ncbi:radical SAM protein with 4Fe4S-binding SPASM domain [Scopulibacillus daqui]|uniref:Radical SAM protein with 4Fe4S-binding SPASM domain n=1 Tax=Scopulibacillus daqui TaxID=1469162 RepID=A0ABS2PYP2_9BACL|nr:FeoB-associated Cys-rich membrane protein [Scopulibacillus daqui]MBM7645137.1 radical SAM protein with 4Fe4S-binding SPASM domain [Scopulibacillus daqui]
MMISIIIGVLIFGYAALTLIRFVKKSRQGQCASCSMKKSCQSGCSSVSKEEREALIQTMKEKAAHHS